MTIAARCRSLARLAVVFAASGCSPSGRSPDADVPSLLAPEPAPRGDGAAPSTRASQDAPDVDADAEAMMRAQACDDRFPPSERGRPSAARIQRWLCDDGAVLGDVFADEGVYEVRVGERADTGATEQTAALHCGEDLDRFVDSFRGELLPYVLAHGEAKPSGDPIIECGPSRCTLHGGTEFQADLHLEFEGGGAQLRLASVVAIDTVLVDSAVVKRHRSWARAQLQRRPASCPTPPSSSKRR